MRRSLAAATAAALLFLTACGGSSDDAATGSSAGATGAGTLTLAAVTPPKSFALGEMASSGPEDNYYQAVYDTLLKLDAEGQPEANLATEWSYDDANTTLTLTLRDDVTFSDGAKLDAAAVKASLEKGVLFPKKLGAPDQLASMVLEAVTNSYLNAETIRVDGGIRMQPK